MRICAETDVSADGTTYKGVKVIGSVGNLLYILPENKLDEIAITLGLEEYYKLEKIVSECEKSGVHTKFIPDYGNIIPTKPYTEDLLGLPVINIRYVPLSNTFNALVKRCMDIVGSLICIVLFSPIMLLTAIAVKVTSKGPLIFKQERVGLHNEPFRMYKFRTMYVQTEEEERKGWTHKDDPRITKIGRFLRKTSLEDGKKQDFNIQPYRPVFNIVKIMFDPLADGCISPISIDLCPSGHAGTYLMFDHITRYLFPEFFHILRPLRSWSHKAHITF